MTHKPLFFVLSLHRILDRYQAVKEKNHTNKYQSPIHASTITGGRLDSHNPQSRPQGKGLTIGHKIQLLWQYLLKNMTGCGFRPG